MKDKNIIIINKFFDLNGKINCLLDILNNVALEKDGLSDKNKKFYHEITQKGGQAELNL